MEGDLSHFHKVLGHPVRRKIVQLLGDERGASFTKLKSFLDVSVGTLYYNLGLLEDFVSQRHDRRYVLTQKGELAYRLLQESEEKVLSNPHVGKGTDFRGLILQWLLNSSLLTHLFPISKLSLLPSLVILSYGMWINHQAQLYPLIFFHAGRAVPFPFSSPILFFLGFLLVDVVGYAVPRFLYGRKGGALPLFVGTSIAMWPTTILPTIWVISSGLGLQMSVFYAQLIMFLSMGYSLCLLTMAITVAKSLKTERAALATLVIFYFSVGLALISSNL
ncbi:MAG TPA: helix-turn-helix domain-containing protein [Patescibacteria group bacterium]|nr:helix-turn-helix domain-containing protein [Patescibacteria group bacterium]